MHALIIEQDAWTVFTIEDVLRECGYLSFHVATAPEDAIELAKARRPDLITSALRLGSGSGIDTVRTICGRGRIPVVFITSTGWELREHYPDLAVVQKPFAAGDLKSAVEMAMTSPPPLTDGWLSPRE